jgi:hypothetical protein
VVYQGNMPEETERVARSWKRNAGEDLWERTLNQIETKMGRLAYLARLRNPETDRYEHYGLIAVFGEEEAENALRTSHMEVLESLLGLSLLDQVDDTRRYVTGLGQSSRRLLSNWEKTKGYEIFLPLSATPAQRALFDANMVAIIRHLKAAADGGEMHPD